MSGNFNSSSIWKLTKLARNKKDFGTQALSYIQEKKYERRLGRYLSSDVSARPLDWGNVCESLAFDRISMGWTLTSQDGYRKHPQIECWTGIKDITKDFEIGDIKCPYTLNSFCQLYEALEIKDDAEMIEALKGLQDGYKYYWQLVSGAILDGVQRATLAIFCPYKSELKEVREKATADGVTWLNYMTDEQLPYLIEGEGYENVFERSFEIPKEEIEFLTNQVRKAEQLL